jgi:hypothetical protein
VTAQDFVRSYQRALTPSLGSEYAYMYFVMKGAEDYFKGKSRDFSTGRREGARRPDAADHAQRPDAVLPLAAESLFLVAGAPADAREAR